MNYLERVKKDAERIGYTETLFKRRRQIPLLKSKLPFLKSQGERIAINAPIQGTTADILKLAMLDINEYIINSNLSSKIKIILQIHDELVLEIEKNSIEVEGPKLRSILENVIKKRLERKEWSELMLANTKVAEVPLKADMKIGDNLYELK